jgi:integrase
MEKTKLGPTTLDAMKLTLFTGMRSGEVVAMRWKDIDLAAGTYQMMDSKNGLSRVVYLNDLAVAVLQGRKAEGAWVFPTRDGRGSVEQHILVNALYRVRESLGLDDFTIHVLRKTMRTGLARLGVSHEVAELCLGHRLGGVAGIYNLYGYAEEQRAALEKWGAKLMALVG